MKFMENFSERFTIIFISVILVLTLSAEIYAADKDCTNNLLVENVTHIGFWSSIFKDFNGGSVVNQNRAQKQGEIIDNNKDIGKTVIKFRFLDLF